MRALQRLCFLPTKVFIRLCGLFFASWFCAITLCGCHQTAGTAPTSSKAELPNSSIEETLWLSANGLRLKTEIYNHPTLNDHPTLIVVLHGDSPFGPPSYQYEFARRAAVQIYNAVVVAILRPGYTDDSGDKSEGTRGETTGDNYTPQVVDAVAQAIEQLKGKFHPAATVLVGHSGGAAITADLLGRWPTEVNAALLVSCPCDLTKWRKHMYEMQKTPIWLIPVQSLSPIELVNKVSPSVHVRMLVGSEDPVAPPALTEEYAEALKNHGVDVEVKIAPGLQHDILMQPVALVQLVMLVDSLGAGFAPASGYGL